MPHREETPMSNAEQLSMPGENRAGGTTQIGTVSDFLREFGSPDEGGTHGGPEARHVAGLHLQRASQIHEAGQMRGNLTASEKRALDFHNEQASLLRGMADKYEARTNRVDQARAQFGTTGSEERVQFGAN